MLELPRSARLVVWANAWLSGWVPLDDVLDAVRGEDEPHEVTGLTEDRDSESLASALGTLRTRGLSALRLALPAPGDPLGVSGPLPTTRAAVDVGEAVVCLGADVCLVPEIVTFGPPGDQGHLVSWRAHPVTPSPVDVPSLAEAERELKEALIAAAAALSELDVASWRPEVGAALMALRSGDGAQRLPEPYPSRAQSVSVQATRLSAVLRLALEDDGAAATLQAANARREALSPVDRTARRALVAACNALSEPGAPLGPQVRDRAR